MKKKGKKGLAVAMTLAVTMTSVPTVFATDEESQLMTLPERPNEEKAKETVWKYEKLDQAPMKESVKASSENTPEQYNEGPARLAFDGSNTTAWHTAYGTHQGPYTIEWGLGDTYNVGKIDYTRKADGANGTWKNIKVEAKKADETWVEVCTKELQETAMGATTEITFEPVEATALRVTVTDSYNKEANNKYASAGEINVYKATKDVTLVDPIKILPEEGKSTTMKEGETQTMRYELTEEAQEAGGTVKWRVQEGSVLNVDENGVVTAVGEGKANVSADYWFRYLFRP